jgi:tetratricopeptide (TPR) repeat protein
MIFPALIASFLTILSGLPPARLIPREPATLKVEISLDSIKNIFFHPEEILKDVDRFWQTDEAFQLSARWHRNNNIPVDMDRFLEDILRLSKIPAAEREADPVLKLGERIKSGEARFVSAAIPHILDFLPRNGLQMETIIYLTAFTTASAFMTDTQIVANIASPKLSGTANGISNILLHEVYHIGYGINRLLRSEEPLQDGRAYSLLDVLHNEGLATYVAWNAGRLYPFPGFEDYRMLEDVAAVREKIGKVNVLFSQFDKLPKADFGKLSWEEGVKNRAYYVAGAHMSRTIDEKTGRKALIETIEKGPRSFVSLYNTLAEGDMKVTEFPAPRGLSLYTRIFQYLSDHPGTSLTPFDPELEALSKKDGSSLADGMNSLGYKLLYKGRPAEAIVVLTKALSFFPKDANLYDTLGEVYMKSGNREKAAENYRKSLDLDSDNSSAKRMLKKTDPGL